MVKYGIFLLILTVSMVVVAENSTLQSEHHKYIEQFGDSDILSGEHQILSCGGNEISVYMVNNRLSTYSPGLYRLAQINHGEKIKVDCLDRIIRKEGYEVLQYTIEWNSVFFPENQVAIFQNSYLEANKISAEKAKKALHALADQMYKSFSELQSQEEIRRSIFLSLSSDYFYRLLQSDENSLSPSIVGEKGRFQVTKSFGVSTNNTRIYVDFGYPVIDISSIRVKGLGGVGFHERSSAVPNVIYFAGIAYPNKSCLVTVTVDAMPVPVAKKSIKIVSKTASLNKYKTDKFIDFGDPVINLRALSITSGAGAVYYREVTGNGVYLKSGIYNNPGYMSLRLEVAVYK